MFKFLMAAAAALFVSTSAAAGNATLRQAIDGVVDGRVVNLADQLVATTAKGGVAELELVINSPGGGVIEGSIYVSAMEVAKARGVTIKCYVPLLAASMAFTILAHCDERFALDGAYFLWHPPRVVPGFAALTPKDAAILANDLAAISKRMANDLRNRMPMSAKAFWYHYHAETLHTTNELMALSPGFIESVSDIRGLTSLIPGKTPSREETDSLFAPWRIIYIWTK